MDVGQNLGAVYALDINGVNQNSYGSGWEIGAHVFQGSSVYGTWTERLLLHSWRYVTCGVQAGSYLAAQLPLNWVNSEEWKVTTTNTINFPSSGTGGGWSCGLTGYGPYAAGNQASAQQAVNDVESCRTSNGSGTTIVFPAGSTYAGSAGLTLPQTARDTSPPLSCSPAARLWLPDRPHVRTVFRTTLWSPLSLAYAIWVAMEAA